MKEMIFNAESEDYNVEFTVDPHQWLGLWLFKLMNRKAFDISMESIYWYARRPDREIERFNRLLLAEMESQKSS